jgi:hypothetical protein
VDFVVFNSLASARGEQTQSSGDSTRKSWKTDRRSCGTLHAIRGLKRRREQHLLELPDLSSRLPLQAAAPHPEIYLRLCILARLREFRTLFIRESLAEAQDRHNRNRYQRYDVTRVSAPLRAARHRLPADMEVADEITDAFVVSP